MAYNCATVSFGVCRARFTKVDASGNVVAGSNSYVTDQVGEVAVTVNVDTGNSITVRNGCGCSIARKKFPDTFNWFEITFTNRALEPALEALILGTPTITNGADVVGIPFPGALSCSASEPTVAAEFWSQAIVGSAPTSPYGWIHRVFPKVDFHPGDLDLSENNADRVFVGNSSTNTQWGHGPYGDGPPDAEDIREGGYWATSTAPPTAACTTSSVTATS